MIFSNIPRVRLNDWPTPLDHLPRFGAIFGHEQVYMKRDDVMGLGMGGNKVRNLEFWLGQAVAEGADVIVAAGGLQSNQCRLAAAAAAKLGLECIILHNDVRPDFYQGNMLLNHLLGAKQVYIGPMNEEERSAKTEEFVHELRDKGKKPYIISKDYALGTLGYANAAFELHAQADSKGIDLRHVVMVGAMAGTVSGFIYGTQVLGAPWQVHVISVEYPQNHLAGLIDKIAKATAQRVGIVPPVSIDDTITIYDDFLGEGYAQPTMESVQTVYDLAGTEGIIMEDVYNMKTVYGLRALVEKGVIPRDEAVAVFHTGGLPTLFAHADLFQPQF